MEQPDTTVPMQTHWTRALHVDLYDAPRARPFRRVTLFVVACSVVLAVAKAAYLEAKVLAHVEAPESAAAAAVTAHVPPARPANGA